MTTITYYDFNKSIETTMELEPSPSPEPTPTPTQTNKIKSIVLADNRNISAIRDAIIIPLSNFTYHAAPESDEQITFANYTTILIIKNCIAIETSSGFTTILYTNQTGSSYSTIIPSNSEYWTYEIKDNSADNLEDLFASSQTTQELDTTQLIAEGTKVNTYGLVGGIRISNTLVDYTLLPVENEPQ